MRIDSLVYRDDEWQVVTPELDDKAAACVVFVFGESDALRSEDSFEALHRLYPQAHIVGASSAGNILGTEISDNPIIASAVQLEKGHVQVSTVDFSPQDDVEHLACTLVEQLPRADLQHVFVLSDGLNINGSELVRGINESGAGVPVTGGMAGDGARFSDTWIVADAPARQQRIVAVGFYGEDLVVSSGCYAGWSEFGSDRLVTRSRGNVLYELDGEPALALYRKYLGDYADDLPMSGMRFPLSIRPEVQAPEVIRTLLAIDEEAGSITFAGDVPEGYIVRLMKPDVDVLIDGAGMAAGEIDAVNQQTALGLVVSCVGRKLVMSQLVEEELDTLAEVLGDNVRLTGFYSYGEIAPFVDDRLVCELHNQTMTLTAIYEKA